MTLRNKLTGHYQDEAGSEFAHLRPDVISGDEAYLHTKGEWEARQTTERRDMSQDQLNTTPRETDNYELDKEDFKDYFTGNDSENGVVSLEDAAYNIDEGGEMNGRVHEETIRGGGSNRRDSRQLYSGGRRLDGITDRKHAQEKPPKGGSFNAKQEEPQPEVEQPKESEESQPAAEQPKESEEQQVMAAEIPKSKKEQKEEIKAAERQDAIGYTIRHFHPIV